MTGLIVDVLSWISFLIGGFFMLAGSFGMIRLPDFWARTHAASIIDSAGAGLIILGLMLQGGLTLVTVKLVLIAAFLFITGPTASHAVANAAFVSGSRPIDMVKNEADPEEPKKRPARAKSKKRKGKA